jgi:dynein heavy chain
LSFSLGLKDELFGNLDLLRAKRNEIQTLKDNYLNGLQQLDYARVAIDAMKKELTELQPKLKETAVVVENLMVKM